LDLATQLPNVRSIAFCCISTGLFGFPQARAAEIAIDTVTSWMKEHPNALDLVVFNVFTLADEDFYIQTMNSNLSKFNLPIEKLQIISPIQQQISKSVEWLKSADAILITGGAGISFFLLNFLHYYSFSFLLFLIFFFIYFFIVKNNKNKNKIKQ